MLQNFWKIAWRNFARNKLYTTINIIGLSIGLTVSMLILIYVSHESNYDTFHENAKKIFWVKGKDQTGNETMFFSSVSFATAQLAKQYDPAIESFLRIFKPYENVILQNRQNQNLKFSEPKFLFADSNFFNFFSFTLLKGNKNDVFKNPFSLVISKKAAEKYFGSTNPIGKVIRYNNKVDLAITGIAEQTPSNSSLDFDFISPLSSLFQIDRDMILSQSQLVQMGSFITFFLLNNPSSASHVEYSLNKLCKEGSPDVQNNQSFIAVPLLKMHLDPNINSASNNKYLNVFSIIAISILLLALINYISLATARSTLRAKEIGVRKVIGSNKMQIVKQFFIESFIYSFIAFILSYVICSVIQPAFFDFLQIHIDNSFLRSPKMLFAFLILLLITIILASSYPSFLLSGYKPSMVLYGKLSKQAAGATVRKYFAVFQFMICVGLIICGLIVKKQLNFFKHKDTGINRNNIVMLPFGATIGKHFEPFKNDIMAASEIKKVSVAASPLFKGEETYFTKPKNGRNDISISVLHVDASFISLLGLQWKYPPRDSVSYLNNKSVMLNEAAIDQLNFVNNGLGERIILGSRQFQVAGVLKDFNYESLQSKINPLCIVVNRENDSLASWINEGGFLYAEIKPHTNTYSVMNEIENIYKKYESERPFEYYFMDDAFNDMYKSEKKLSKLSEIFISITLFIACLGLFGLSAFIAQQRSKEISIRKVMGASSGKIVALLSKDFLKPVLIAILIASPIAWWLMNKWLQSFAYRINISIGIFLIAGTFAILIAILTVSSQAIRAALVNPIKSLRSE
ncbi:MAG TPA: ABC transporter permease [Puia sp.]|nr:ABC transporter permease [Puia sp.]